MIKNEKKYNLNFKYFLEKYFFIFMLVSYGFEKLYTIFKIIKNKHIFSFYLEYANVNILIII